MVIYDKLTIGGTTRTDYFSINLKKAIGDSNSTASFTIDFDNFAGKRNTTFSVNDEVVIFADKDPTPVTIEDATVHEFLITGDTTVKTLFGTRHSGQQFTIGISGDDENHEVTSIRFKAYRFGNPGTLDVEIFELDGNGHPTGTPVSTGTTDGDTLLTGISGTFREVTMSAFTLVESTQYALIISAPNGDTNNKLNWRLSIGGYSGGFEVDSINGGTTWTNQTAGDFMFEISGKAFTIIPTTKIFTGVIKKLDYKGNGLDEQLIVTGQDLGTALQDIIVKPRVFKDAEVSTIVTDLMSQNVPISLVTVNNVNVTTTTLDKITFSNISMFDALKKLSDLSEFYFFVDENKDLNFIQRDSVSTGLTLDNTNTIISNFNKNDRDLFNIIQVTGARQLTGAREIFEGGAGSSFVLDAKPHNVVVTASGGGANTVLQPGGIVNLNDPATDNVQYLVDFQGQQVIAVSGIGGGGDNILPTGSAYIIDYQRSTPLTKIVRDNASVSQFGPKNKNIIDQNIRDINEANTIATQFLTDHKDLFIEGDVTVQGIIDVTPGKTVIIDMPFQDINTQTYKILTANYRFNKRNNLSEEVLSLTLNKKISNFVDSMKDQMLRLRSLESSENDAAITNIELSAGSVGVSGTFTVTERSIGSGFYFHVQNHNIFNSPTSLLGDMRFVKSKVTSPRSLVTLDNFNGYIYFHSGITFTLIGSLSQGVSNITGVTINNGNLITVDGDIDYIYLHEGLTNTLTGSFAISGDGTTTQLAVDDNGNLLQGDSGDDFVTIYSGISSTVIGSIDTPGINFNGITVLNGNMITSDRSSDYIYQYQGVSSTVTGSFPSPDTSPRGLSYTSGGNLISADSLSEYIYTHSGVSSTLLGSFTISSLIPHDIVTYIT